MPDNQWTIYLDLDGVIVNFFAGAVRAHGMDPDIALRDLGPGEYDLAQAFDLKDFYGPLEEPGADFWANLDPYPYKDLLVSKLASRGELIICSKPTKDPFSAAGKMVWMKNNLPDLPFVLTNVKHKLAKPFTVLIDDADHNCRDFQSHGGRCVVFPQKWNSRHHFLHADRVKLVLDGVDGIINRENR